jgi:hypothetical protein
MPEIKLQIKNCKQCPHLVEKRIYTEDSFERPHDWICNKKSKIIRHFVTWNEEEKIPIPNWCLIVIK